MEDSFNEWFDDENLPPDLREFCWRLWKSAFRAGGHRPWYSVNREQLKVLIKSFEKDDNDNSNSTSE